MAVKSRFTKSGARHLTPAKELIQRFPACYPRLPGLNPATLDQMRYTNVQGFLSNLSLPRYKDWKAGVIWV